MAVSTTDTYSGPYSANGSTVEFPFTFKAASEGEIRVFILSDGVESDVSPDDYAVSLTASGGTVVFDTAPPSGDVYIESAPSFTQPISFSSGQAYRPETVNEANDRAAIRDLHLKARTDRAFSVPFGEAAGSIPPLAERAGKVAIFSPDGGMNAVDSLGVGNPDFQDDGLWSPSAPLLDDGAWG